MSVPFSVRFAALAVVLGAALAACFGGPSTARVSSDYTANVSNVGVVSLLSPGVNVSFLGTSALESQFVNASMAGWDVDALVYETLLPRFQRKGYTSRAVPRDDTLEKARLSDWRAPLSDTSVAAAAYAIGEARGLDMIVIVHEQVGEDFVTGTNQKVRGFGLQQAFDTEAFVYATVLVEAYDVKKRYLVGRAGARQFRPAAAGLWDPAFKSASGNITLASAHGAALSAELAPVLRETLGVALQEAGL